MRCHVGVLGSFVVGLSQHSPLEELNDWLTGCQTVQAIGVISYSAKGEPVRPPMALFKATLLSIWYD
ncbi:hypothetical protein WKW50_25275 [Ochrobactrum sp. GPK 3]|uniref:hypothetical protein n=1 Tax=Brucella sp. 22210 TaxID=3453892 RepID=UPI003138529A